MSAQMAAIIREGASDLTERWAMQITNCLGLDLSPYPDRDDPRLLTGLASYLDPGASQPAALLQLSRRAREWGRLAELRGIEEDQILDAYLILADLLWKHLESYAATSDGSTAHRLDHALMIVMRETVGAYRTRHLDRDRRTTDRLHAFSRMVSHEIKGPVSVISGAVDLLTDPEQPRDAQTHEKFLGIIRRNTATIAQMVDDLLALSMAEEQRGDHRHSSASLADVVPAVLEAMASDAARQGVRLESDGKLPDLLVDSRSLQLVLSNLVSNAIRYADPSRTDRYVRISAESADAGGHWAVRVEDNGLGVPADAQERIFARFYRAHSSLPIAGTGLGLSIVREVVEGWGGQIRLTSRPGKGSVFRFTAPAPATAGESPGEPTSRVDDEVLAGIRRLSLDGLVGAVARGAATPELNRNSTRQRR